MTTHHESEWTDADGVVHPNNYKTYVFPELFSPRTIKEVEGGVVVTIHGRRFRISIEEGDAEWGDHGVDTIKSVTFTETDEPESPTDLWDIEVEVQKLIAYHREAIEAAKGFMAEDPEDDSWYVDDIAREEDSIKELEGGYHKPRPRGDQWGGQPGFIQGEYFPTHEGYTGRCLVTLETGWGDSGNVIIMLACDSEGYPCKVWYEASCC